MRRRLLHLTAIWLVVLPGLALAAPAQDSAKGRGTNFFGQKFSFSATSTSSGFGADGTVQFEAQAAGPVTVLGEVTCLRVVDTAGVSSASIAGRITGSRPNTNSVGQFSSFVIQTSDAGKFSNQADTAFFSFSTLPPPPDGGCPAPSPALPISSGDVVIENAFP